MSFKTILGVVIVAMLIGVLYVVFEKNFLGGSAKISNNASSAQELGEPPQTPASTLLNLPTPAPTSAPINESSDLLNEAQILEMRDYSAYFEDLKSKANQ